MTTGGDFCVTGDTRGATRVAGLLARHREFQSAPPHGGRLVRFVMEEGTKPFQSAPPHGGRPGSRRKRLAAPCFNPRPRTGGDCAAAVSAAAPVFQSAPPHGGRRRDEGSRDRGWLPVSIRAPARGATALSGLCRPRLAVSIRAPARGATRAIERSTLVQSAPPHGGRLAVQTARCASCFNPRPRTGGDGAADPVSIRAPARGATCPTRFRSARLMFQSAPPHGGRRPRRARARSNFRSRFNPRPRTGGDRRPRTPRPRRSRGFNPRPRTGGDVSLGAVLGQADRFNPRPRTGGDQST